MHRLRDIPRMASYVTMQLGLAAWRRLKPIRRNGKPHGLPTKLFVTVASYPPRFPTLALTLRALLDQTVQADGLLLWVPPGSAAQLPAEVRALEQFGLVINEAPEDLRSFNKIVHALKHYSDATLIIADDDTNYPGDWLEGLVEASRSLPGAIVCNWAKHVSDAPPPKWRTATDTAGGVLMAIGVGGVVYPPGSLHPDVTRSDIFGAICPSDDIWLGWMAHLHGTPVRWSGRNGANWITWRHSQKVALWHTATERKSRAMLAMTERYGRFPGLSPHLPS